MSLTDDFLKGMQERNLVVQKDSSSSKKKKKNAWYENVSAGDDITTELLLGLSTYKPGRDEIIAPVRTTRASNNNFVAPTPTVSVEAPVKGGMSVFDFKDNKDWTSVVVGGKEVSTISEPEKEDLTFGQKLDYGTKWAANAFLSGLANFNSSITSTADLILGKPMQALGWEKNPVSKFNESMQGDYELWTKQRDKYADKLGGGKGINFAGQATEAVVAALPDALLALATAGGSKASTAANLADDAFRASGNFLQKAGLTTSKMLKNPQYWTSFARSYGNDYNEAKENGASSSTAGLTATIKSLVNSGIEVGIDGGSGIQGLPDDLIDGNGKKWLAWVESSLEEGGEEGLQGFISRLVSRVFYDEDEEVLDAKQTATDIGMGTFVGAILGGGQNLAVNTMQNAESKAIQSNIANNGQLVSKSDIDELIAEQKEKSKGGMVSKKDIADIEVESKHDPVDSPVPGTTANEQTKRVLYTGSPNTNIQQFKVGGDGTVQTGDRYGRGVYLTTNEGTAQNYAGENGRVYKINADGLNIFNLNDPITPEMQESLRNELKGADKQARNSILRNFRTEQTFDSFEEAEKFFNEQRKLWKEQDGEYAANKPEIKEADHETGKAVIEFTDFANWENNIANLTGNQLYDALKSISTDDFSAFIAGNGFDGIAFDEDSDNQQYVIYRNEDLLQIDNGESAENAETPTSTPEPAPVSPELQSLYDKRQALQDTIMARYNDGLYNEETENLAKQWDIVNRQIADMESAQKAVTPEQTTVQQETVEQEQREPTTTEKVQKHFRDEVLDFDKIFESDTPENVAKFNAVSNATELAQDFISKGTDGVKSIPDIFSKISESGELDNFESYLRHRLNVDRSTLEQRYGSEVSNRPVFSDYTAEQSQKIADDLERKHPEFKQAAEDVYAFNNYLLDLRVKAGRVTQEWANQWRDMYPHYVPLSRSRHGNGQIYSVLLDMIQGKPLDTSDSGAVDSFLGEVDTAAEVHKITSSGNDFNPLIDTMVNQAFTVYWDLAANQPGSVVAPVADSGIQSAPIANDTTTETEQSQPEVDSVTIETEVPAESNLTEYDPHHLMDSKKGVGKVIKSVTDAVEVYVLDDAMPFEKVAKKTGTSLDASYHATRNSFSSAQHFIGNGNEAQGVRALTDIVKDVDKTKAKAEFLSYLGHLRNIDGMSMQARFGLANNQNFMGKNETFAKSNKAVRELEAAHPEFKKLSEDIYAYTDYLRNQFVERGMLSQEDADLWKELYPHYVPMRFAGGSVDSMLETLAHYTTESFNTLAMNEFGVDLKNALQTEVAREPANILSFINRLDSGDSLFLFGKNGDHHTFSVYENGERVTFDITDEMYMALNDAHKWMDWKIPVLHQVNEAFRKFCTEWNIFFSLKNGVKDPQDIIYNSKHPLETYAHLVDAGTAIASKELGQQSKYSHYYEEYLANGGEPITFFDSSKNKFTSWKDPGELLQYVTGLKAVGAVNDRVEKLPRLAEYIASREAGRTVKEAMLDSAQVTTNFAAGGKLTKFLNRNGCTFLNASVQGALQHIRNFSNAATGADGKLRFDTKEAKVAAVKGVASLIARGVAVGMATIAINDLRWKDDEEYEQLPDYVKDGYYLLFKFGDGQFFRIPKGRTNATVEEGIRQVAKESIGDDEADWDKFWQIFFENIAPNNPLTNNIFAPIREVAKGETWYGEDLIPSRLQKEDTVDQFDEKTDRISVALSKKLNESSFNEWFNEKIDGTAIEEWLSKTGYGDGFSPKEINYLINSYTGVLGDLVLPHFTPKAETSSDNPLVQALAPLKDIFTTDSVLNNKLTGEFYDTLEEVEAKAETKDATPEDKLKSGILIGYNVEISDLMKEQREIQNSDMPDSEKYQRTRELKKEINALQEEALGLLEDYEIDGNYAESGDKRYNYDAKDGTWWEVKPELANGKPNPYYVQEQLSHDKLGLSYADFWNGKRPSPDFEGKTYYAEYNGKRYNYDVDDNSWYEIKPKKKDGDDNYYYQSEQIAHNELGVSYEDFWNNREAYMDAVYMAKNGVEYGWGTPYYETVKTAIGMDSFAEIASGMANIKGESRYDDMNKYIYSLDIPEVHKHILFKAEYPKTNKYNHEIIDYLNEREDISYKEMESILKELGFEVDSKGHITW